MGNMIDADILCVAHACMAAKRCSALYTAVKYGDQVSVRRLQGCKPCAVRCRRCSKTFSWSGTSRVPFSIPDADAEAALACFEVL